MRFALLGDFADAPRPHMPEDPEYLEIVVRGIEELNRRHGAGRFFLFHRQREWNESEQRWMGWARKRGKLEQLNRFLIGESAPELNDLLCAGDRTQLKGIRFVITLDADTQLLRELADTIDLLREIPGPANEPAYQQSLHSLDKLTAEAPKPPNAAPAPGVWPGPSTPRAGTAHGIAGDISMMAVRWARRNVRKPASIHSRSPEWRLPASAITGAWTRPSVRSKKTSSAKRKA